MKILNAETLQELHNFKWNKSAITEAPLRCAAPIRKSFKLPRRAPYLAAAEEGGGGEAGRGAKSRAPYIHTHGPFHRQ